MRSRGGVNTVGGVVIILRNGTERTGPVPPHYFAERPTEPTTQEYSQAELAVQHSNGIEIDVDSCLDLTTGK